MHVMRKYNAKPQRICIFFTFSSHTEYVKRESIVIARVKKKSLLSMNVHVLYELEHKTSLKKFRVSVWPYIRTYVDFGYGHNNFRRS